ncbi:hypothetical protein MN608_09431 [Microdochium nivale]|nr:hypothetical protein MN608_09431 [Microdochium nivale]
MNLGAPKHHPNCEPEYWIETEETIDFQLFDFKYQRTEFPRRTEGAEDFTSPAEARHAFWVSPPLMLPTSDLDLARDSDGEQILLDQIQDHGLLTLAARLLKANSKLRSSDPNAERIL